MENSSTSTLSDLVADIVQRFDFQMALQVVFLCVFVLAGLRIIINSLQPARRYRHWTRTNGTITHIENYHHTQPLEYEVDVDGDDVEEMIQPEPKQRRSIKVQYNYAVAGQMLEGHVVISRRRHKRLPSDFVEGKSVTVVYHPVHLNKSKLLSDGLQPKGVGRFIGALVGTFFVGIALYILLPDILGIPVTFGPFAK